MTTNLSNSLYVRILSPKQVFFTGQADSVSSTNSSGKFDILPAHSNFISFIENSPIIVRAKDKPEQSFNFPFAIIYTVNNIVNVYTDIQLTLTPKK